MIEYWVRASNIDTLVSLISRSLDVWEASDIFTRFYDEFVDVSIRSSFLFVDAWL